jgi:hypothetical protein
MLAGNLRTMELPEVLRWVAYSQKTGTLYLQRRSIQKRILFRQGTIYTSWSNDPRESLCQFLMRERRLTEEELYQALLRQEDEGRPLGLILVRDGLVQESELKRILKTKAEETIYDLFLWPDGAFDFKEGPVPDSVGVVVELTVQEVILEGVRRLDEWKRIREVLPSPGVAFLLKRGAQEPGDRVELQVMRLAAVGKTLAEISIEMRRSEFETAMLLCALHERGLIEIDTSREIEPLPDPVTTVKELLTRAGQCFTDRNYDLAIRAYEEALAIDRLNQAAKKGLVAAFDARHRVQAIRSVPLEAVPVIAVALQTLTMERLDPQEGFVLSRLNGDLDVREILKICPLPEEEVLLILAQLRDKGVIEFRRVRPTAAMATPLRRGAGR